MFHVVLWLQTNCTVNGTAFANASQTACKRKRLPYPRLDIQVVVAMVTRSVIFSSEQFNVGWRRYTRNNILTPDISQTPSWCLHVR